MRQGFLLHGGKRLVQLVPMVDDNHQYQWVLKNTLQHDQPVSVGLQSVLFVPTDVCACAYKGPPCVQSNSYSLISLILRWIDLAVEINLCCRLSM